MKRFTLIELLVVIAIMGVLISILLPSLKRSRDLSMNAVCQSNLKQMGMGYTSMVSTGAHDRPTGQVLNTWEITLQIEEKHFKLPLGTINYCPTKDRDFPEDTPAFGSNNYYSYGGDFFISQIDVPSEMINLGNSDYRGWPDAVSYWITDKTITDYHVNKKMFILMFDFSLKKATRSQIVDTTKAPYFKLP